MRPPSFWRAAPGEDGVVARLLDPVGRLIAAAGARRRAMARPFDCGVPVICVGNLTAGGQGKTPTALAIGEHLIARGANPWFLTRGYGGSLAGPVRVDPARHRATEVGDEALLLAVLAPTVVARDRPAGARRAVEGGASILIMDDGFQNPSLAKTLSLVVVDGGAGFGNQRLIPAGPLREPIASGLARASALILIGRDTTSVASLAPAPLPVLTASLVPTSKPLTGPLLAFAGIGRPEKFFESLTAAGAHLVERRGFPDHHRYTEGELERLATEAAARGARLITTTKDHARLSMAWRDKVDVFAVRLAFDDPKTLDRLLEIALERAP